MIKRLVLHIVILSFGISASGQDVQLTQYYNVPSYLNPSMVGMGAEYMKVMTHTRFQWRGLQAGNFTNYIGMEKAWADINSGAGIMIGHDNQGSASMRTLDIQGQYAYGFNINENERISLGINIGIVHRKLGNDLIFPDQYTSTGITGSGSADNFNGANRFYPDIGGGAIFYSKHLWVGLSAFHINRPDQSFTDVADRLPSRIDFHAGYKIDFSETKFNKLHHHKMDRHLYPIFNYKLQGKSDQMKIGLYFKWDLLILGTMYRGIPTKRYNNEFRNNESLIFMGGIKYNNLHITYSYDAVISQLAGQANGAHELNLTIVPLLAQKAFKRDKPMKVLPCPAPLTN